MTNALRALGSLRLTLVGVVMLAVGTLSYLHYPERKSLFVYLPLAILMVNLVAAIATRPAMRRQRLLLVFHLCLLVVLLLVMLGELMHFKGRVELTEGAQLAPQDITTASAGKWHRPSLEGVVIEQGPVRVSYAPNLYRQETTSRVTVSTGDGAPRLFVVDDNHPLVIGGYRFYITSNKGYSALLLWQQEAADPILGAVNFPSFPLMDWKQLQQWETPTGEVLDLRLDVGEVTRQGEHWSLTSEVESPKLEISRPGFAPQVIGSGEALEVAGGLVQFYEVRMWMGYHVYYNPTLPWLFAAALIGVVSMTGHLYLRLGRQRLGRRMSDIAEKSTDLNH